MKTHANASTTLTCSQVFQVTSHVAGYRSVLRVVNLIVVAVTIYSILTCTQIPCRDSHCENGSFEVLSLHLPSVAARPPSAVNELICNKIFSFVLETIRTGAMHVIHITVETAQRRRDCALSLYCTVLPEFST